MKIISMFLLSCILELIYCGVVGLLKITPKQLANQLAEPLVSLFFILMLCLTFSSRPTVVLSKKTYWAVFLMVVAILHMPI